MAEGSESQRAGIGHVSDVPSTAGTASDVSATPEVKEEEKAESRVAVSYFDREEDMDAKDK